MYHKRPAVTSLHILWVIFFRPSINTVRSILCRFFISDLKFSIGLRSGLFPHHPLKSFTPWLACHFFMDSALCARAPGSIRVTGDSLHLFCLFLKIELFLLLTLISKRLDLEQCGLWHRKDLSFLFPTITDFLIFEKRGPSYDIKHLLRFFLAR